jgi:hypothetical protein
MAGCELLDKDVAVLLSYLSWLDYYAFIGPAQQQCDDELVFGGPSGQGNMRQAEICEEDNRAREVLFTKLLAAHVKKMQAFLGSNYRYNWCCAPKLEGLVQMLFKLGKPRSWMKGSLWPDADSLGYLTELGKLYVGLVASVQIAIIDAKSDFKHC